MMDMLIVKGPVSEITSIYNNFGKEGFFLKTRFETIGNTLASASFRCVLTDLED
jgi:hypothetical protein